MRRIKLKPYNTAYFFKANYYNNLCMTLKNIRENNATLFESTLMCQNTDVLNQIAFAISVNTHMVKLTLHLKKEFYYENQEFCNRTLFSIDDNLESNIYRSAM